MPKRPKKYASGPKNGNATLTEAQVIQIWFGYTVSKRSIGALARSFEVSHRTVSLIVHGQTWKYLKLPGRVVDGTKQ